MKIIDLLNRIANGEEVPKKFRYDNNIFVYDEEDKDYIYSNGNVSFFTDYFTDIYHLEDVLMILNDEVEIIEDEFIDIKEIENKCKRNKILTEDESKENIVRNFNMLANKINDLIKNQHLLINKINERNDKND